jgi:hypothetical protein
MRDAVHSVWADFMLGQVRLVSSVMRSIRCREERVGFN